MARHSDSVDETSSEPRSKFKQTANPRRPEALAMRRLVVANGFWLSPFMRDAPLPILSEWEKTVDLSNLAAVNYVPADPDRRPDVDRSVRVGPAIKIGKSVKKLADLRRQQNDMNSNRKKSKEEP